MSSDFYCRRLNPEQFALIYAGAQKNAGPSGVTIILLRDDLLERVTDNIPTILNYKSFAEKHSLYNTPNTFGIYVVNLVMNWIKSQGGIDKVEEMNNRKASLIYETLDASDFYMPHARKDSRSIMNIVWRLNTEELEKLFVEEAKKNDLVGLKGHRSVGGIRASIYNAMTHIGTQALVDFMKEFERVHG
jgi:phosphoserine aminotransferase